MVNVQRGGEWEGFDQLPDGYWIERGETDYWVIYYNPKANYISAQPLTVTLGVATPWRNKSDGTKGWTWRHNFRAWRFDTLDALLKNIVVRHRLGTFDKDSERQVF